MRIVITIAALIAVASIVAPWMTDARATCEQTHSAATCTTLLR